MARTHDSPAGSRRRLDSDVILDLKLEIASRTSEEACTLRRGEAPMTSTAEAHWDGERVQARIIAGREEREARLARAVAHRLCRASRRRVTCEIGLGTASSPEENADREAWQLVERAARCLTEDSNHRRLEELALHEEILAASAEGPGIVQLHSPPLVSDVVRSPQGSVLVFAPLYVNDACLNDCVYCGFRRSNRFKRTHLKPDQVLKQAEVLSTEGHRTIDLVTGEIPSDAFVDRIATMVERIREQTPIHTVNLNLGALSPGQYRRLVSSGAHGYHIYQETYHAETYFRMHRSGAKQDMAHRLEAPGLALEAGFPAISMGILVGLRPLEEELSRLTAHARILQATYPHRVIGFSLPRLQPFSHDGEFEVPFPVEDEPLMNAFAQLRERFPASRRCLTTRESSTLRNRMLELGLANKISAGASTRPGGYGPDALHSEQQFQISDERSLAEMRRQMEQLGLDMATA